jgi:hypothetical protein
MKSYKLAQLLGKLLYLLRTTEKSSSWDIGSIIEEEPAPGHSEEDQACQVPQARNQTHN